MNNDTENSDLKRKIKALEESKHPTLFETKMNVYYGLMHRILKIGKAKGLLKEALKAIWILITKDVRWIHSITKLLRNNSHFSEMLPV